MNSTAIVNWQNSELRLKTSYNINTPGDQSLASY